MKLPMEQPINVLMCKCADVLIEQPIWSKNIIRSRMNVPMYRCANVPMEQPIWSMNIIRSWTMYTMEPPIWSKN